MIQGVAGSNPVGRPIFKFRIQIYEFRITYPRWGHLRDENPQGSTERSGEGAMQSIDPASAGRAEGEANPVGRPIFDPDQFGTFRYLSPTFDEEPKSPYKFSRSFRSLYLPAERFACLRSFRWMSRTTEPSNIRDSALAKASSNSSPLT